MTSHSGISSPDELLLKTYHRWLLKLKDVSLIWQKLYQSNQTYTAGRLFQFNHLDGFELW